MMPMCGQQTQVMFILWGSAPVERFIFSSEIHIQDYKAPKSSLVLFVEAYVMLVGGW